ncbi:hypothetical protein R3P38DRAFT_3164761 [Favolaschia claudopus]|uniref:Uncharacterized protein n=1 Tax=Favolaschia claudopus TaxID=2862362 RepID=A0AAW0EI96_9AGAR
MFEVFELLPPLALVSRHSCLCPLACPHPAARVPHPAARVPNAATRVCLAIARVCPARHLRSSQRETDRLSTAEPPVHCSRVKERRQQRNEPFWLHPLTLPSLPASPTPATTTQPRRRTQRALGLKPRHWHCKPLRCSRSTTLPLASRNPGHWRVLRCKPRPLRPLNPRVRVDTAPYAYETAPSAFPNPPPLP